MSQTHKPCAICRHVLGAGPFRCGLFNDEASGRSRLTYVARDDGGPCGPDGAFHEAAGPMPAQVIVFPVAHRRSA